eukprot:GHVS01063094.1.p2 GENE.GHVS01063094.1~~GHVS01063094.1.p2  ORF type:complete len:122 (-),score=4.41 GHVS01063094.1:825-1190(-)
MASKARPLGAARDLASLRAPCNPADSANPSPERTSKFDKCNKAYNACGKEVDAEDGHSGCDLVYQRGKDSGGNYFVFSVFEDRTSAGSGSECITTFAAFELETGSNYLLSYTAHQFDQLFR